MKSRLTYIWIVVLITIGLLGILTAFSSGKYGDFYSDMALKNEEIGASNWTVLNEENICQIIDINKMMQQQTSSDGIMKSDDVLILPIQVEESGEYELYLEYKPVDGKVLDTTLLVEAGEESFMGFLPVLWRDKSDDVVTDRYGNELNKEQSSVDHSFVNVIGNNSGVGKKSIQLHLEKGSHEIKLSSPSEPLFIKKVYVVKGKEIPSYQEYTNKEQSTDVQELIVIEGESYNVKSDSFIRGKGISKTTLSPYDTYVRKINVVDESSWKKIGQKILWEFEVEEEGYYSLGFRYSQFSDANKSSYREIEIDGQVPFLELKEAAFPSTRLNQYKNYTLGDKEGNFLIYLTKGSHTISMKAIIGPMESAYEEIVDIMKEISNVGMDLKKLTAGSTDKNRTWDMETYLPDVPDRLLKCADRMDVLYEYLKEISGVEPVYANDLVYAADTLRKLAEKPRTLPNNTELLNEGDKSVSSSLGNIIGKLTSQPLSIDRIYLSAGMELPKDRVSPFTNLAESVKTFTATFLPGAGSSGYAADLKNKSDELQVWVNMSIQYTEVLQQLLDRNYNSRYGTNIQLSVMPNSQKLILANATNTNPDVVLGLPFFMPYDLAIRGAAKNLLEYDDFLEFYSKQYNLEGLVPLAFNEGVYGAVDSLNYQVLFYRKDIMEDLGLKLPETWEDVAHMMPELLRYSMNFNTSISNVLGFKDFNATGPFLYQNKGKFYESNGLSTAFDSPETIKGFIQMTELFQIYALSEYIANFYNSFRYGEVPIGIGGFSTYVQLQVAAPELTGLWDIALIPGQRQEDGSVLRYQAADSTASMIFSNTEKEEEAYRFLKWWLSEETQVEFAYNLESRYGAEYRWNTANLSAFKELPYPEHHKKIVLEQLGYQKENARHPAGYMVERESSNIWNNVIANGKGLRASIDRGKIIADREIVRKLKEFGFLDEDGNLIKPYPMDTIENLKNKGQ